jgi:hypothetical protein
VVFLIDEVQFADEVEFRAVISALHRATQRSLPITMAAAGLPQIPRLTGEARSYAERLFHFPVIANLEPDAATTALAGPARARDVDYRDEAIELAVEWTGGYPFYIQQLGKHAWNLAERSPIDAEVISEAIPAAQAALDSSIYQAGFQRATDAPSANICARWRNWGLGPTALATSLARLGSPPRRSRRSASGSSTRDSSTPPRNYGHIDFTIPRFDEFMRRHMPYRPVDRKRRAPRN